MHGWFSSPTRSIVTAVAVASAFGAIVALIAVLEQHTGLFQSTGDLMLKMAGIAG